MELTIGMCVRHGEVEGMEIALLKRDERVMLSGEVEAVGGEDYEVVRLGRAYHR